jgi:hypothetical protein
VDTEIRVFASSYDKKSLFGLLSYPDLSGASMADAVALAA